MNEIVTSDNISYLKTLPDEYIDLVVTSPPYDALRDYNGYELDLHGPVSYTHLTLPTIYSV